MATDPQGAPSAGADDAAAVKVLHVPHITVQLDYDKRLAVLTYRPHLALEDVETLVPFSLLKAMAGQVIEAEGKGEGEMQARLAQSGLALMRS